MKPKNAGKFNKVIEIKTVRIGEDSEGFNTKILTTILTAYAEVKTTKGYTLITSNTDFEKAYTNFTIRYPNIDITRDMIIAYKNKEYSIEYINNINEENVELELQAKEITK